MKIPCGLGEIQCCCHGDKAAKIVYIKALKTHCVIISRR